MYTRTLTAAAAVALLASAMPSHATLQIAADFGGSLFSCVDNDPLCDTDGATGRLQLADQLIGGVAVNGSVQTSTGTVLTPGIAKLNTSSLSVTNTTLAPVAFAIAISDKNFLGPVNSFVSSGSGTWELASGSDVTLGWYNDALNRQGATTAIDAPGILVDSVSDTAVGDADAFSHSASGAVNDPGNFSMTLTAEGTLTAGGALINRGQTEIKRLVVAEPGSLALLAGALAGFVALRRRMRPSA
jgi:hypothetical protein